MSAGGEGLPEEKEEGTEGAGVGGTGDGDTGGVRCSGPNGTNLRNGGGGEKRGG